MSQLMPLPLAVSCFSKIQIGFIFLVPAEPGGPFIGQRAVKWVCVFYLFHVDFYCILLYCPLLGVILSIQHQSCNGVM